MNEQHQAVIDYCNEPRTAAEISKVMGVTRWYIYAMCRRKMLKNVTESHGEARYVAAEEMPLTVKRKSRAKLWAPQSAIEQVSSIWHYAERMQRLNLDNDVGA